MVRKESELFSLAYPVKNCVYMVKARGKREFYQSALDAFHSQLYQDSTGFSKIVEIPVIPISQDSIENERRSFVANGEPFDVDFLVDEKFKKSPKTKLMSLERLLFWVSILVIWGLTAILWWEILK